MSFVTLTPLTPFAPKSSAPVASGCTREEPFVRLAPTTQMEPPTSDLPAFNIPPYDEASSQFQVPPLTPEEMFTSYGPPIDTMPEGLNQTFPSFPSIDDTFTPVPLFDYPYYPVFYPVFYPVYPSSMENNYDHDAFFASREQSPWDFTSVDDNMTPKMDEWHCPTSESTTPHEAEENHDVEWPPNSIEEFSEWIEREFGVEIPPLQSSEEEEVIQMVVTASE